jgi:cytoskeletal protein CcmA (bactofilin family)
MSLWQKPDSSDRPGPTVGGGPVASPSSSSTASHDRDVRGDRQIVNIGQSIEIRGELTGNEDLTIDGRIDGKIILKDHHLTIGANGRIRAEIRAKSVLVKGEVVGNVVADDKVEIAPSGSVQGDLCAPRVALADGSRFKGSIDMAGPAGSGASKSSSPATGMPKEMPRTAAKA